MSTKKGPTGADKLAELLKEQGVKPEEVQHINTGDKFDAWAVVGPDAAVLGTYLGVHSWNDAKGEPERRYLVRTAIEAMAIPTGLKKKAGEKAKPVTVPKGTILAMSMYDRLKDMGKMKPGSGVGIYFGPKIDIGGGQSLQTLDLAKVTKFDNPEDPGIAFQGDSEGANDVPF